MILGCIFAVIKPEYIFTAITIIIGASVAYTAYNQYRLSKEKFKLDMFDKRYGVYKNTQVFLSKFLINPKIEMKDFLEFRAGTQDSVFLFKDDIPNYLEDIHKKAFDFWEIRRDLDGAQGDERSEMVREKTELFRWLHNQLPELKNKFAPYLKFKTWK